MSLTIPFVIRATAITLAVGIISFFSLFHVSLIYVVLAFGHLAMAFWYQREAGKWEGSRFWVGMALLVLLVAASNQSFAVFLLFTNFIFSVHMMLDETHLMGGKPSLFTTLEGISFVALYSQLFAWALFGVSYMVPVFVFMAATLGLYVVLSMRAKRMPNRISALNFAWVAFALILTVAFEIFGSFMAPYLWFYALGMVHFFIWYGEFFRKVAQDASRKITYLSRVVLMNVLGIILLAVFLEYSVPALALLFAPAFVNAWTVWHILTSIRGNTVLASFSLKTG